MARNIFEKIWDAHLVHEEPGESAVLYIDRHYVHEVTSPQAFEGLRLSGRKVRRAEKTYATMDHNIPTTDRSLPIRDPLSKKQVETLKANCAVASSRRVRRLPVVISVSQVHVSSGGFTPARSKSWRLYQRVYRSTSRGSAYSLPFSRQGAMALGR